MFKGLRKKLSSTNLKGDKPEQQIAVAGSLDAVPTAEQSSAPPATATAPVPAPQQQPNPDVQPQQTVAQPPAKKLPQPPQKNKKEEEIDEDWDLDDSLPEKVPQTTPPTNSNEQQQQQKQKEGPTEQRRRKTNEKVKVILLGDSAVGKSKLVERFLMDGYYTANIDGETVEVDFWDTAGQERFNNMHPSYYHQAHVCILVFDTCRKITYKNLDRWYKELQEYRKGIPCIVVANKIDVDMRVTQKQFNFAAKRGLPFYFASASEGTNVVKIFNEAIRLGKQSRDNPDVDFVTEVLDFLNEDQSEKMVL